jgi:coenzyme F420-reducing hydrogenase delta subunit
MRVMCTGRVDPSFILRAFSKGADGVFIGGCHLNECNYTTHGNFYALRITSLCKKVLERLGLNPERLRIEFISGGEGNRFAEIMNDFSDTIHRLGPLGAGDGLGEEQLKFRLGAATRLIPSVKLFERERFRVRLDSEAEYEAYFASDEFKTLFDEAIGEKLATSQILLLLEEKPRSTREISEVLGLEPAVVSRQMKRSSRQGLVSFDEDLKCYALS